MVYNIIKVDRIYHFISIPSEAGTFEEDNELYIISFNIYERYLAKIKYSVQ